MLVSRSICWVTGYVKGTVGTELTCVLMPPLKPDEGASHLLIVNYLGSCTTEKERAELAKPHWDKHVTYQQNHSPSLSPSYSLRYLNLLRCVERRDATP